MRLFCLADQATDWIPKQILAGFCRHTNHELVDTPSAADLIWVQSYYADLNAIARPGLGWRLLKRLGRAKPSPRMYRLPELAGKPVLVSLHHLTPGREHEFAPKLAIADRLADAYHFFSSINIPFIGKFVSHPGFHLPYWIDLEQFRPLAEAERVRIRRDLELPAGRRIIGSFQRDTEADGISPKPEKGPDLLCDILEHLERDTIFVLLSGPRRAYVERRLASAGIPFRSLGHSDAETMNALYNALDVYLVTSRTEGGPQAILECMATGTPILSTPVGIADVLEPWSVRTDASDFVAALEAPFPDITKPHLARVQDFEIARVVARYDAALELFVQAWRQNPSDPFSSSQELGWNRPDKST